MNVQVSSKSSLRKYGIITAMVGCAVFSCVFRATGYPALGDFLLTMTIVSAACSANCGTHS